MKNIPFTALAAVLVAAAAPAHVVWGQADGSVDPYARILVEHGIETDAKGVLRPITIDKASVVAADSGP